MNSWNSDHIPDLTGTVVIVTGGNTGIGLQAVMAFAAKGAETILACRNETKALKSIRKIRKKIPGANVRYMHLDLGSLASVKHFAQRFREEHTRLDILLNNAGLILNPYRLTEDGFESQIGVNHLGHFALTGHLLGLIAKTEGARVVTVSSRSYRKGRVDFDNFQFASGKGYSRFGAYTRSKLANLLFTYELERKFRQHNINAISIAAHPGYSYTDFGRAAIFRVLKYMFYPLVVTITQSSAMGALPSLRAAVDPEVNGADFIAPGGRWEIKGFPVKVISNGASNNKEDARLLWEISEELTGVNYL